MKRPAHRIKLPPTDPHTLGQDQAYFFLEEHGEQIRLRFHDYPEIYRRPGLYEQLFYDRLKCSSPEKLASMLSDVLRENGVAMSELRVLDVGAGNGMMGEVLMNDGVARMIGIDISTEAYTACERDRPGIYDAYYVVDLTGMDPEAHDELRSWRINCMTTVAALGFGDIPPHAFAAGFDLVERGGWICFNIKETFLRGDDRSGFSSLTKELLWSDTLEIHHLERYRHRISIDGMPLYYFAIVGRKKHDIPAGLLERVESDAG